MNTPANSLTLKISSNISKRQPFFVVLFKVDLICNLLDFSILPMRIESREYCGTRHGEPSKCCGYRVDRQQEASASELAEGTCKNQYNSNYCDNRRQITDISATSLIGDSISKVDEDDAKNQFDEIDHSNPAFNLGASL